MAASTVVRKKWSNRPLMADVARLAGVSTSTVSRALKGPAGVVSTGAHARVSAAAEALAYVPNMMAGSLAAASTRSVGIVVPTLNNSVFAAMLDELTKTLGMHGYQTMIGNSDYSEEREEELIASFLAWSPAAIVLTGLHHTRGTIRLLVKAGLPVFEVGEFSQRGIDSVVGFSHYEVGRAVARHFVEQGATGAGLVMIAVAEDYRAGERAEGFRSGVRDAGADLEEFIQTDRPSPALGAKALAALVDRESSPRAIFFSNDVLCLGGLFEAQRRGLKVPDELRLCGYGDQEFMVASTPTLSSVRPPDREIGRRTAETLLERFQGNSDAIAIDLGFQLIARESS